MNYSVKKYINNNCTGKYELKELSEISNNISTDSNNQYSKKGALTILCRYAIFDDNKIIFDTTKRNTNQTFESIKKQCENKNLTKETKSKTIKKGGFGDFSSIPHLLNNDDEKEKEKEKYENCNLKKETKSKTIKKGGFGNFSSISHILNNNDEKELTKQKDVVKKQSHHNTSLFDTTSNNRERKSGFGIFTQSNIHNSSPERNNNTFNSDDYRYPTENSYTGVYRQNDPNELYGPYGTDNYHDELKSDILNSDEKRRVDIYRHLAAKYYPGQRSGAWFALRNQMITASDGGTVVGLNPYEHKFGFTSLKITLFLPATVPSLPLFDFLCLKHVILTPLFSK